MVNYTTKTYNTFNFVFENLNNFKGIRYLFVNTNEKANLTIIL